MSDICRLICDIYENIIYGTYMESIYVSVPIWICVSFYSSASLVESEQDFANLCGIVGICVRMCKSKQDCANLRKNVRISIR